MRHLSFLVAVSALIGIGCSHESQKADAAATVATKAASTKSAAASPATAAATSAKVECSVKGDNRIIEVRDAGKGCELAYTKAGKEGIVATASHGKAYCEKAMERLSEKLKGAGYACK